ncbi:hypothetical protein ACOME3_008808 [Neoechinorhynchus agilis]
MGLKTSEDLRLYALSKKLDKPFSTKGKITVIQLSVKFEQHIDCGGGYIKILGSDVDVNNFSNDSVYRIMFGPDICGSQKNAIHVILEHKGHFYHNNNFTRKCEDDIDTHIYTLILDEPAKTYEIKVDNKSVKNGSLENDYDFLAPKKIKDPKAIKPEDWDDREVVDDPEDKKPEDWDKPEFVKSSNAEKPSDWNEEVDGEWESPMVPNPEFKGEWKPRKMKNPAYKGPWIHPMVDNPDYVPDPHIGVYEDLGLVGFDLWQVKAGTVFSDILITDDIDYAARRATEIVEASKEEAQVTKSDDLDEKPSFDSDVSEPHDDVEDEDDEVEDSMPSNGHEEL